MAGNLARIASDFFGAVLLFHEAPEAQRPTAPALRHHLLELLDALVKHPEAQRLPADEVEEGRFALVAWADETINRSNWSSGEEWLRNPLQLQLYRTNRAGEEFHEHLARLRPDQNQARAVYLLCLAFGFEGRYSGQPAERDAIMRQQFEMLRVSGLVLDVSRATPLTPPAYQVEIEIRGSGGKRLWPALLGWAGLAILVFAALWAALRYFATSVPLPPGA